MRFQMCLVLLRGLQGHRSSHTGCHYAAKCKDVQLFKQVRVRPANVVGVSATLYHSVELHSIGQAAPITRRVCSSSACKQKAVVCAHCAARGLGDTVLSSQGKNIIISTSDRPPVANQSRPAEPICVRACALLLLLLLLQDVASHCGLATLP